MQAGSARTMKTNNVSAVAHFVGFGEILDFKVEGLAVGFAEVDAHCVGFGVVLEFEIEDLAVALAKADNRLLSNGVLPFFMVSLQAHGLAPR